MGSRLLQSDLVSPSMFLSFMAIDAAGQAVIPGATPHRAGSSTSSSVPGSVLNLRLVAANCCKHWELPSKSESHMFEPRRVRQSSKDIPIPAPLEVRAYCNVAGRLRHFPRCGNLPVQPMTVCVAR
jgi:hypothetical protein